MVTPKQKAIYSTQMTITTKNQVGFSYGRNWNTNAGRESINNFLKIQQGAKPIISNHGFRVPQEYILEVGLRISCFWKRELELYDGAFESFEIDSNYEEDDKINIYVLYDDVDG